MHQEESGLTQNSFGLSKKKLSRTRLRYTKAIFCLAFVGLAWSFSLYNGNIAGLATGSGENGNSPLVMFKGQKLIESSIRDIFVVLYDMDHKAELLDKTVDFRVIDTHSTSEFTIYNHMDSPFFLVHDRDVILKTDLIFDPKSHTIHARFWSVPHKDIPPRSGIQRMGMLKGRWVLEYKGPNKTMVTYAVEADPGGWIPMWVVNLVNKEVPARTIANMARQARKQHLYRDATKLVADRFDLDSLVGL